MDFDAYSFAIGYIVGVVLMGGAALWIIADTYHKRFGGWPWGKA